MVLFMERARVEANRVWRTWLDLLYVRINTMNLVLGDHAIFISFIPQAIANTTAYFLSYSQLAFEPERSLILRKYQ